MEHLRERTFAINTEIIITFFTDRFYNRIHSIAQEDFAKNGGTSITDTYARIVKIYLSSIEQSGQELRETITALHVYYCKYAGECTLGGFIASIVAQIIPEEFFSTMDDRERDGVFRDLIKQIVMSMGKRVLKVDLLRNVIDERKQFETGVMILRGEGERVIRDFKASIIAKLYSKGESKDRSMRVVAAEHFDKVRKELVSVLTEVCALQVENERLKEEIRKAGRAHDELAKKNGALACVARELQEKLVAAQQQIALASAPKIAPAAIAPVDKPAVFESKPVAVESKPAVFESKPVAVESKPAVFESKPVAVESKPAVFESKPVAVEKPIAVAIVPENKVAVPIDFETRAAPKVLRRMKSPPPPPMQDESDEELEREIANAGDADIDDFAHEGDDEPPVDVRTIAQSIAKKAAKNSP